MDYGSRSPFLAGLLSLLFPGLGHAYCGEAKRGLILFIVLFAARAFAFSLGLLPYQIFNVAAMDLVLLSIYLFVIIDSVRIARPLRYAYLLKRYN